MIHQCGKIAKMSNTIAGGQQVGFSLRERRLPPVQVTRVLDENPAVYTDEAGNTNYSGGLNLQSESPTPKPPLPGDKLIAEVKGTRFDSRA